MRLSSLQTLTEQSFSSAPDAKVPVFKALTQMTGAQWPSPCSSRLSLPGITCSSCSASAQRSGMTAAWQWIPPSSIHRRCRQCTAARGLCIRPEKDSAQQGCQLPLLGKPQSCKSTRGSHIGHATISGPGTSLLLTNVGDTLSRVTKLAQECSCATRLYEHLVAFLIMACRKELRQEKLCQS